MYLIVGLGNPGKEYAKTRHNVGFLCVDKIAKTSFKKKKDFEGEYAKTVIADQDVILLKPLTYMNLSGRSVQKVARYFDIPTDHIIVIHDDIDLPLGKMRIVKEGSSGGQKGVQSIIDIYGKNITRIKIGITGEVKREAVGYVLSPFTKKERETISTVITSMPDVVAMIIEKGVEKTQNQYN